MKTIYSCSILFRVKDSLNFISKISWVFNIVFYYPSILPYLSGSRDSLSVPKVKRLWTGRTSTNGPYVKVVIDYIHKQKFEKRKPRILLTVYDIRFVPEYDIGKVSSYGTSPLKLIFGST